jgi:hypothetical protein
VKAVSDVIRDAARQVARGSNQFRGELARVIGHGSADSLYGARGDGFSHRRDALLGVRVECFGYRALDDSRQRA